MMPALTASVDELQAEIERVLSAVDGGETLTIHSGEGQALTLQQGGRAWLSDDGRIDTDDRQRGAVVSNLPAGSIYTTVLEDRAEGSLWLPKAGDAEEVVLHFEQGRIRAIEAARGGEALGTWLDEHSGEPRRISHIGVGLNPYPEAARLDHRGRARARLFVLRPGGEPLHRRRKRLFTQRGLHYPGRDTARGRADGGLGGASPAGISVSRNE